MHSYTRNKKTSKSELDLQEAMCTLGRKFDSQENFDAMMITDPVKQGAGKHTFTNFRNLNEQSDNGKTEDPLS